MVKKNGNVLVTGANGFIGRQFCARLNECGYLVKAASRNSDNQIDVTEHVQVNGIDCNTDWSYALKEVSVVVHLAARVHVMSDKSSNPLAEFRKVNVEGTLNLAEQAAKAGVKRLIFLSSIKVNGENTELNRPFTAEDIPKPEDPYGLSKLEAEQGLLKISKKTGMEVVIVRPPLVYGAGVKANFAMMLRLLKLGLPLPFGSVNNNRRSFIGIDNLVDFLMLCIHHPAAANQIFLVSDDEDISTAMLLKKLGEALGRPAKLINISTKILEVGFKLIGKKTFSQRLLGNLQIDIIKNKNLLGWEPLISVDEGFHQIVKVYK